MHNLGKVYPTFSYRTQKLLHNLTLNTALKLAENDV